MTSIASSTIAALCYANPSKLDFPALAAELEDALRNNPALDVRVSSQYDDFIILDLSGLRICLAFCDFAKEFAHVEALHPFAECLVIAVGPREDMPCDGPLFERRKFVFEGLVERVENRHPTDRFLLIELNEAFSEYVYDSVVEHIWQVLQIDAEAPATPADPPRAALDTAATIDGTLSGPYLADDTKPHLEKAFASTRPVTDIIPDDVMDDLARRYDAERGHRGEEPSDKPETPPETPPERSPEEVEPKVAPIRPTHPAVAADRAGSRRMGKRPRRAPAKDRAWLENAQIRMALYPPESDLPAPEQAKPLLHRAAIHSMNASVMAFSLPLGAVALTYTVLGRESFVFTGRLAALTGFVMGLAQTQLGNQLLSAFV